MTTQPFRFAHRASRGFLLAAGALAMCALGCRRRAPQAERTVPASAAGAAAAPSRTADPGYALRSAERAAVDQFLRAHPDLRVASDADHRRSEDGDDVEVLYGVYHPYFLRGDVNDDGVLDFVLGFVRLDSDRDSPWFSIVVFPGRADGGFSGGVILERDISLADGDLSIDRDSIVVTPDVSEDAARRYRWDPLKHRHVFVRDLPEEPVGPPPAQI